MDEQHDVLRRAEQHLATVSSLVEGWRAGGRLSRWRTGTAVVVRGPDVAGVAAELRRRGHEVKDAPGPEVALVVETDPSTCELASVRTDMAAERVVVGLAVNPLLADTVRPGSDGILVPAGEALVDAVVALLDQPLEIARLGFEGRASVAAATWARVLELSPCRARTPDPPRTPDQPVT